MKAYTRTDDVTAAAGHLLDLLDPIGVGLYALDGEIPADRALAAVAEATAHFRGLHDQLAYLASGAWATAAAGTADSTPPGIDDFFAPTAGRTAVCRICGALVAHHGRERHRASHGSPDAVGAECEVCHSTLGCMCGQVAR